MTACGFQFFVLQHIVDATGGLSHSLSVTEFAGAGSVFPACA